MDLPFQPWASTVLLLDLKVSTVLDSLSFTEANEQIHFELSLKNFKMWLPDI